MPLYLGTHCPKVAGMPDFDTYTKKIRNGLPDISFCPFHQIFISGPYSYKRLYSDEALAKIKETGIRAIAHGSYVSNPWKLRPQSIGVISRQLADCNLAGLEGLVIHLDKNANNESDFISAIEQCTSSDNSDGASLILEINASAQKPAGDELPFGSKCLSWHEPEKIMRAFDTAKDSSAGTPIELCIDTAHLFSSGVTLETRESAEKFFDALEVDSNELYIHLNDSVGNFGTGKDIHGVLGQDKIWGNGDLSGLEYIMELIYDYEIPAVLERNKNDIKYDLQTINKIFSDQK